MEHHHTQRRAFIMRGVPGSGKSTVAKTLVGEKGKIHSTDEYFYQDGIYRFEPRKLSEYHDRNFLAFEMSLAAGIDTVICDNTNIVKQWYYRYVCAANKYGYMVAFIVMPHPDPKIAAARNAHNVPEHIIRRMIANWED